MIISVICNDVPAHSHVKGLWSVYDENMWPFSFVLKWDVAWESNIKYSPRNCELMSELQVPFSPPPPTSYPPHPRTGLHRIHVDDPEIMLVDLRALKSGSRCWPPLLFDNIVYDICPGHRWGLLSSGCIAIGSPLQRHLIHVCILLTVVSVYRLLYATSFRRWVTSSLTHGHEHEDYTNTSHTNTSHTNTAVSTPTLYTQARISSFSDLFISMCKRWNIY